jgi:predicted amidohydrolase
MKIAVAQIIPVRGNIPANIERHQKLIDLAVSEKSDAIFFPELSMTGYEPELAKELATNPDDKVFDVLQKISNQNNITIGFGMPTATSAGIRISMIILQPDKPRQTYSKQQLHTDELPYFVSGEKQTILTVDNKKIAPAICYESLQPTHSDHAKMLGAEIYVASVAKSQNGIDKAMKHYPQVAQIHSMPVLMSNCVGYCGGFLSVGQTSVWAKHGVLLSQLNNTDEGMLVFDTETEKIVERAIKTVTQ